MAEGVISIAYPCRAGAGIFIPPYRKVGEMGSFLFRCSGISYVWRARNDDIGLGSPPDKQGDGVCTIMHIAKGKK